MPSKSEWYHDAEALQHELRRDQMTAPLPLVIEGYDKLRRIRQGGQGVVYEAVQLSTKRRVAVKVLLEGAFASESAQRRFEREIELIASLRHPNIVSIYDSGTTVDGRPYYVMEYIEGAALDELLGPLGSGGVASPQSLDIRERWEVSEPASGAPGEPSPLPVRAALSLFAKVCEAVTFAHQRGVIHRDLKPSNIRIDPAGEPHVLDFGLAKSVTERFGDASQMSRTGDFIGSLPWASPEQAEGDPHKIDVRTDVYSLGVMLFQMLTGRFPYTVCGPLREVLGNIQTAEPPRPSNLRKGLDDEIDTIVLKCLAKEPERRYQGAGELTRDVRHYLAGEPIEAKRDSALYTLRKAMRRYKYVVRAASAIVVIALGAAVVMSLLLLRAMEAEQLADEQLHAAQKARAAEVVARDRAEKEAAQAREINRFLTDMLATPLDLGREARVADVLDEAAAGVEKGRFTDPEIEAALRETIGSAYASLGMYEPAEVHLRESLSIRQRVHGGEHRDTLASISSIAWLLRLQGKLDESEELYRKLLSDRKRTLGEEHVQTVRTMNDLAITLEERGKLEEAEQLHRQALDYYRRTVGEESVDTITSMGNLASVLHWQGKLQEAEALMRARVELARRVLDQDHRDTLTALNNLAALQADLGNYEEGVALAREVLAGRRRALGEDHPETIVAMHNLASALRNIGSFEEAETLQQEAVSRARQRLGPEHPDTLAVIASLASLINDRGRHEQAEPLWRSVLDGRRRTLGDEHPDTLQAMNNLGKCLQMQGKLDEAKSLYRGASEACRLQFGEEHPYTLTATLNLASVLGDAGRFDEAEPLVRGVLDSRRRVLGEEHPGTLNAQLELANLLLERGDAEQATRLMASLVESARRVLPPDHWFAATVQGFYGKCLMALGRFAEAEQQVLAAYEAVNGALGAEDRRTRTLLERLVELYEAWGKPEDAGRYRALLTAEESRAGAAPDSDKDSAPGSGPSTEP